MLSPEVNWVIPDTLPQAGKKETNKFRLFTDQKKSIPNKEYVKQAILQIKIFLSSSI